MAPPDTRRDDRTEMKIKSYDRVNRHDSGKSFGISRMEDIYTRRQGRPDRAHRHDYYTVLLIRRARGKHIIDFNSYALDDGQVYFITPGQVHLLLESEKPRGFSMVFSQAFLVQNNIAPCFMEDLNLFNDCGSAPPLQPARESFQELLNYGEQMYRFFHADDKFKTKAIGALLELFLICCNAMCTMPRENTQKREAGNGILKKFKELVEEHFTKKHNLTFYARELNISPDYLNRTIKALIGKTAKAYIQSRIILEAKRRLYFTHDPVKEIAYTLGFREPAHFSSFFKTHTRHAPSRFRREKIGFL